MFQTLKSCSVASLLFYAVGLDLARHGSSKAIHRPIFWQLQELIIARMLCPSEKAESETEEKQMNFFLAELRTK